MCSNCAAFELCVLRRAAWRPPADTTPPRDLVIQAKVGCSSVGFQKGMLGSRRQMPTANVFQHGHPRYFAEIRREGNVDRWVKIITSRNSTSTLSWRS